MATIKIHAQRLVVLQEKEELLRNGGGKVKKKGDVRQDAKTKAGKGNADGFVEVLDSDEEYEKLTERFAKLGETLGSKQETLANLKKMKLPPEHGADNSTDEEDYSPLKPEPSYYSSRISTIDEIKTVQQTLIQLKQSNQKLYSRLMQGLANLDLQGKIEAIFNEIDSLIR